MDVVVKGNMYILISVFTSGIIHMDDATCEDGNENNSTKYQQVMMSNVLIVSLFYQNLHRNLTKFASLKV